MSRRGYIVFAEKKMKNKCQSNLGYKVYRNPNEPEIDGLYLPIMGNQY